jgi:hypothetical protein
MGVIDSKWDPMRKELSRLLLEEQDRVLRTCFEQKGGGGPWKGREAESMFDSIYMCMRTRANRERVTES